MNIKKQLCLLAVSGILPAMAIEGSGEADPAAPKNPPVPAANEAGEKEQQPGYLGIYTTDLPELLKAQMPELKKGAVIRGVVGDSPAQSSGLKKNDILLQVDGKDIKSPLDVMKSMSKRNAGDEVTLQVLRGGEEQELKATLGERPADQRMAQLGNGNIQQEMLRQLEQVMPEGEFDQMRKQLLKQAEQLEDRFEGIEERFELHVKPGQEVQRFEFRMEGNNGQQSSARIIPDADGKIELKSEGDQTNLLMFDQEGKLLYEGPYNEDADLDAIPDDLIERLKRNNLKPGDAGMGNLRIIPRR